MFNDSILFLDPEGPTVELQAERYHIELELEDLLAASPSLLGGAQMTPGDPRRWLLVRHQYPICSPDGGSGWAADLLFLDQDGVPTLVEVKRADNRELRRSVVGQVLDYAAGLMYGPPDGIRTAYERAGSSEALATLLKDSGDAESFWSRVSQNVSQGRIRMIIAADEIPTNLQAVVELLNEQLQTAEVFALGVLQYIEPGGRKVLVPRLAGATAAAQATKPSSGPGPEALLHEADETVRQTWELLRKWGAGKGLDSHDTGWARQWHAPGGEVLLRFYPKASYLEVDLHPLLEAGKEEAAKGVRQRIKILDPRKNPAAKYPAIYGPQIVGQWPAVEALLDDLLVLHSG